MIIRANFKYINPMNHRFQFNPETGINIVCLGISAFAPALAIGPVIGTPTGIAIALGLMSVIRAQQNSAASVRSTYYVGAWFIRVFAGAFEVMAYTDVFAERSTLPFSLSPTVWAWITAAFMAALDLWALSATSARAEAAQQEIEIQESIASAERQDHERRAEKAEEEERKRKNELERER